MHLEPKHFPKLKSFLWRIKSVALPVGSAFLAKGIQADLRCKRCGEVETTIHILLTCPFSASVWDLIQTLNKPMPRSDLSISELLLCCTRMINLPPTGLASNPVSRGSSGTYGRTKTSLSLRISLGQNWR